MGTNGTGKAKLMGWWAVLAVSCITSALKEIFKDIERQGILFRPAGRGSCNSKVVTICMLALQACKICSKINCIRTCFWSFRSHGTSVVSSGVITESLPFRSCPRRASWRGCSLSYRWKALCPDLCREPESPRLGPMLYLDPNAQSAKSLCLPQEFLLPAKVRALDCVSFKPNSDRYWNESQTSAIYAGIRRYDSQVLH